MSAPLRVLHVVPGMTRGGAERALLRLVDQTRGALEHSVVSLADSDTMVGDFAARGVRVELLGARRGRVTPRDLLRLRGMLRAHAPQVIDAWMYHAMAACALLAPRGVPLVWSIRAGTEALASAPLSARIAVAACRRLTGRADAILYNSHAAQEQHRALGLRAPIERMRHNGVELPDPAAVAAHRARVRAELGVREEETLFAIVGRPHRVKGHGDFLEAATQLARERPGARFLRLGRDPVARDANPGTAALMAAAWILHVDEQPDPLPWIAAADVLVSASWSESCPNVVQEAMAAGRPVVTTEAGDSAMLVGATGWTAPPRRPELLAQAMRAAFDAGAAERSARGAAARERAGAMFDVATVARLRLELYRELAARAQAGAPSPVRP
ncbi:MAG: glycosyltransferase [Phycisphaerales bacterium]